MEVFLSAMIANDLKWITIRTPVSFYLIFLFRTPSIRLGLSVSSGWIWCGSKKSFRAFIELFVLRASSLKLSVKSGSAWYGSKKKNLLSFFIHFFDFEPLSIRFNQGQFDKGLKKLRSFYNIFWFRAPSIRLRVSVKSGSVWCGSIIKKLLISFYLLFLFRTFKYPRRALS